MNGTGKWEVIKDGFVGAAECLRIGEEEAA